MIKGLIDTRINHKTVSANRQRETLKSSQAYLPTPKINFQYQGFPPQPSATKPNCTDFCSALMYSNDSALIVHSEKQFALPVEILLLLFRLIARSSVP